MRLPNQAACIRRGVLLGPMGPKPGFRKYCTCPPWIIGAIETDIWCQCGSGWQGYPVTVCHEHTVYNRDGTYTIEEVCHEHCNCQLATT